MERVAERALVWMAVLCLLIVVLGLGGDTAFGCGAAKDDRASGYIDQPRGEAAWRWLPPGIGCTYRFDEAPDITVTVDPPLYRIPVLALGVGTIAYVRRQRRQRLGEL